MHSFDFRIPWPPSLNTYYVSIHGRKVLSKKGRLYKEKVSQLVAQAGVDYGISTAVEVEIKLAPPRNGVWDGDNYTKAIFDSLTRAGIWEDDSLVEFYSVRKLPKYAMGEVYLTVTVVEEDD